MADYRQLIDDEIWAFIDKTNACYPPEVVDFRIDQQRDVYETMCAQFYTGRPDTVSTRDETLDNGGHRLPVRIYDKVEDPAALVVYCHGGGFVVGGLDSHDDVCAEICDATGYRLVSIDYRLSPEHRHPAAFDDALAGFEWAASAFDGPIVIAGDSAGGNLAAAVSHAARSGSRQPVGQVLIYPALGSDTSAGSFVTHADAPLLTRHDIEFYEKVRFGDGEIPANDPTVAPLDDSDFSGLPPTVIVSAECDPLCDDGRNYRDALLAAGGRAVFFEEKGLVHGYLRARRSSRRAGESFARIVEAVDALGKGKWIY